jgi:hypothetical protein
LQEIKLEPTDPNEVPKKSEAPPILTPEVAEPL